MLVKKCPQCGAEYDLNAVFCNRDGARLEEFERDDDPYIGKVIRGCRILSRLGKGGMGAVYLAEHEELGLRAVKVIHRELAPDASFIERFRVEARAASRIEHPNVIKVYDFGKTDDNAFAMVMEFLEGESLAKLLEREKRLAPERAVSIAVAIARGLGAAHELDIVHRDLKPDNVMILKNGRVKVVDFGIAKVVGAGNLTGTGNFIGTPHYASPEQALGQRDDIDKPSDIFTLGLMLYEMLSGRLPYDCAGKVPLGILVDRVSGKPLPLIQALPAGAAVPESLSRAVMRALAREPKDRQASAGEFADEIEAAMRPVVVASPPPEPPVVVIDRPIVEAKDISIVALLNDLNALLPAQFEEVLLILNVPVQFLPGKNAPRAERVAELIRWARQASALEELDAVLRGFRFRPVPKLIEELPEPFVTPAPAIFVPKPLPKTYTNLNGMKFVLIPAGKFLMGGDGSSSEKPMHEVTIGNPFYLGKYQVTQGEWKVVMGDNPSQFKGNDRLPVDSVSWNDCQDFITVLNDAGKGVVYRLPSEAEWEYACRAGTTGDYAGNLDEMGWYSKNSGIKTHPVGLKKANAFDLHDMHGNASEWCQDRWHDNYNGAPDDGSAWETGDREERVLRGGSWHNLASRCRSASRGGATPTRRDFSLGLRVVMIPART